MFLVFQFNASGELGSRRNNILTAIKPHAKTPWLCFDFDAGASFRLPIPPSRPRRTHDLNDVDGVGFKSQVIPNTAVWTHMPDGLEMRPRTRTAGQRLPEHNLIFAAFTVHRFPVRLDLSNRVTGDTSGMNRCTDGFRKSGCSHSLMPSPGACCAGFSFWFLTALFPALRGRTHVWRAFLHWLLPVPKLALDEFPVAQFCQHVIPIFHVISWVGSSSRHPFTRAQSREQMKPRPHRLS